MESVSRLYSEAGYIPFSVNITVENDKKCVKPPNKWSTFTLDTPGRIKKTHNGLALRTGAAGNLIVVDVDDLTGWLNYLTQNQHDEPLTCTQVSQSGGRHYFFAWEPRFQALKSSAKVIPGLDVDVRGNGGMIVCFPTAVCYPDGTIRQYTWMPDKALVGDESCDIGSMPDWLWSLLFTNQKKSGGSSKAGGSTPDTRVIVADDGPATPTTQPVTENAVPKDLLNYIVEKYAFFPEQIEKLVYKEESMTLIVQTSERRCMFALRNHSSNHQYFVIRKNGEISRQCHSGDCKSKKFGKQLLPDDLLRSLSALFPEKPVVDMVLVEQAREEAKQNAISLYKANADCRMDHVDGSIQGNITSFLGNTRCLECKAVGSLTCVTKGAGSYVYCRQCTFRFPTGQEMVAIDESRYPKMARFFMVLNVQQNTTNNYNNYVNDETPLGWNEFASDDLVIIESDSAANLLLLKALSGTHLRLSDLFVYLNRNNYRCVKTDRDGIWYQFRAPVWIQIADSYVRKALNGDEFLTYFSKALDVYKRSQVSEREQKVKEIQRLMSKLEADGFRSSVYNCCLIDYVTSSPDFLQQLDKDRNLLGFTNGIYDLSTGLFRQGTPDDHITKTVGYDYDPEKMEESEATGAVLSFLGQVFPDPHVCRYVRKFLASLLAGYTKDQLFHFGLGTGANGKGILLQLMQRVLGDYAQKTESSFICNSSPDPNAPTPALTALVGRRFVYISEVVEGSRINEAFFKQLSGQDRLTYRPLYGESRSFDPEFKLFLVCNELPKFNGADPAMRRRNRVIPFVSTFTSDRSPDPSKNVFPKDDTLMEKLDGWRHAMMGLLLRSYKDYQSEGLQDVPIEIRKYTDEYQAENDIYRRFVQDCLVKDDTPRDQRDQLGIPRVSFDELFNHFERWVQDMGITEKITRKAFPGGVEKIIFDRVRTSNERKVYFPNETQGRPGLIGWKLLGH